MADLDVVYPDIDCKHIETEEAVRYFHSAFYEMVVAKYGEFKARQLLKMPPLKQTEINKHTHAGVLFDFLRSGLTRTEFAEREDPDNPQNLARNMYNWFDDEETMKQVRILYNAMRDA
jgi:hypothetical protein